MKRKGCLFVLLVVCLFSWSAAWADFYVVATGKRAKRTILVSPQTTETASGTALLNALAKITDASASNPYLIIIEPGIYDVGGSHVQMKSYVDIQGSGRDVTVIEGNNSNNSHGVVNGPDFAELRMLSVTNFCSGDRGTGILNSSVSPRITDVLVQAFAVKESHGIRNIGSSAPIITNVEVHAFNGNDSNVGVLNWSSAIPILINVTAEAYGPASATEGSHNAAINNLQCHAHMTNVTAKAYNGHNFNHGVWNSYSDPTMDRVKASANGSATSDNRGIYNNYSDPVILNSTAEASSGTYATGVYNSNSLPHIMGLRTRGYGSSAGSYGIYNENSSTCRVDNSFMEGITHSVFTDTGCIALIGNSHFMGGGAGGGGTNTCAGVHDGAYTFYAGPACP